MPFWKPYCNYKTCFWRWWKDKFEHKCCQNECLIKGDIEVIISIVERRQEWHFLKLLKITGVFKTCKKNKKRNITVMWRCNRCYPVYTYSTPAFFFFMNCLICSLWSGMKTVCCTYCGPHNVCFFFLFDSGICLKGNEIKLYVCYTAFGQVKFICLFCEKFGCFILTYFVLKKLVMNILWHSDRKKIQTYTTIYTIKK